jgi:transcriptional regulator with XRE-family HTH domain
MNEVDHLVATVKRLLKARGLTYRDLARSLRISEPSVKRLFATQRLTLDRLAQICKALGYTVAELAAESNEATPRLDSLSASQEAELVSDPKLLIVAVCALNHWKVEEMVAYYHVSLAECVKRLLHLDRLGLIELLPGNRIRLTVSRDFEWQPGGPIARYFREQGQSDFLDSNFHQTGETMAFVNGMLAESAVAQIQAELRKLRTRFAELHVDSVALPLERRMGMGLMLALRRWEPAAFAKLRRK